MSGHTFRILSALAVGVILASCQPARQIKSVIRSDLFSIGFGLSENQIDLSTGEDDSLDIVMREGIFHILDGSGKKVMKLSSYGDLLALLYDPSRSPNPEIMKPTSPETGQQTKVEAQGRFAAPITFVSPEKVAVDSNQTIYVADRVASSSARIYDSQSAAYCDRIVRRFGERGVELPYLGQEGPGGSPFPYISAIDIMENDTIAVVSASESAILVHHFGKAGNLLSSLRLGRESLPLPESLSEPAKKSRDFRIHANLDKMLEISSSETFEILTKIDYYKEFFDPQSLVISREEFAGSWLFTLDGASGRILRSFAIVTAKPDAVNPELIGLNSGLFYLLSDIEVSNDNTEPTEGSNVGSSRMLQLVDEEGKVQFRYRIELPRGVSAVIALKVSSAGQVYALLQGEESIRAVWWAFR